MIVPRTVLAPDYGLANGSVTEDAASRGFREPLRRPGSEPRDRAVVSTPLVGRGHEFGGDPAGLALTTETTYEAPGTAWLRRLDKRMPAAVAQGQTAATAGSTFTYWGDAERPTVWNCGTAPFRSPV